MKRGSGAIQPNAKPSSSTKRTPPTSPTPVAVKFDKHEDHFENDTYVVTSAVGHLLKILGAPEEFDVKRGKWSFAHLTGLPPRF